jgi:hypothetical protein
MSERQRHYRTPLVDNLHPVTSFIRTAVASEPNLAWPGEIDTIIEDAEDFEEELIALAATTLDLDSPETVERLRDIPILPLDVVRLMENEGVVTWGDDGHRDRFLAALREGQR